MNSDDFSISIFDRFYYRSKKRFYDFFDKEENPYHELLFTIASIWASFIGLGVLPTELFEKYKPKIELLPIWINERIDKEYMNVDVTRSIKMALVDFSDEIIQQLRELRKFKDVIYVRYEYTMIGAMLVRAIMPKEYFADRKKYGFYSDAEYALYAEDDKMFDMRNEYDKFLYECCGEMQAIGIATEKEFFIDGIEGEEYDEG